MTWVQMFLIWSGSFQAGWMLRDYQRDKQEERELWERVERETGERNWALYGYPHPDHASWSPLELRVEAKHVEDEQ